MDATSPVRIVPSTMIAATDAASYQRITRRAYLQGVRFMIALLNTL